MSKEEIRRYLDACHAMQSGVAYEHEQGSNDQTPKHLRVGINTAMCDHGALVKILVDKGIITEDEYHTAIANMMELEVKNYEDRANKDLPNRPIRFK